MPEKTPRAVALKRAEGQRADDQQEPGHATDDQGDRHAQKDDGQIVGLPKEHLEGPGQVLGEFAAVFFGHVRWTLLSVF